jgi:hypothetical protein
MTRLLNALVACVLLAASPAFAATSTVSTSDALWAALKAAAPGDVVQLADGTYPSVSLYANAQNPLFVKAAPGITVIPAPGAHPVLGGLSLDGAQGLTFRGLEIQMTPAQQYGAYVGNAARIVLDGLTIHQADGSLQGVGVFARNSTDIAVTNSEIHHTGVGVTSMDVTRAKVAGNSLHDIATDGIDLAGSPQAMVDGNRVTSLFPEAGAHPDCIQAWATAANPSPDGVQITNNVCTRGLGTAAQGIFIESHSNITIRDNAVACTMANGIGVSTTNGALIEGNFDQGCDDFGSRIIARGGATGSSNITVRGNTVTQPVVNLVQAGDMPVTNFAASDNTQIAVVKTPPAGTAPDTSDLDAWVAANIGAATAPTVVVIDPRDAQIAALTQAANDNAATVSGLQAQLATAIAQLASLTAADKAQIAGLNSQVASLTAQLNASSVTTLKAQIAGLKKTLSGIAATANAAAK